MIWGYPYSRKPSCIIYPVSLWRGEPMVNPSFSAMNEALGVRGFKVPLWLKSVSLVREQQRNLEVEANTSSNHQITGRFIDSAKSQVIQAGESNLPKTSLWSVHFNRFTTKSQKNPKDEVLYWFVSNQSTAAASTHKVVPPFIHSPTVTVLWVYLWDDAPVSKSDLNMGYLIIWRFPKMGVPPNHPFWGTPNLGNLHIVWWITLLKLVFPLRKLGEIASGYYIPSRRYQSNPNFRGEMPRNCPIMSHTLQVISMIFHDKWYNCMPNNHR